jgi:hypothetical protein
MSYAVGITPFLVVAGQQVLGVAVHHRLLGLVDGLPVGVQPRVLVAPDGELPRYVRLVELLDGHGIPPALMSLDRPAQRTNHRPPQGVRSVAPPTMDGVGRWRRPTGWDGPDRRVCRGSRQRA